jgi:DNA-binding response OmpR family regulator
MKALNGSGHEILVVDDEPSVCQSIRMLLEHDGHGVQLVDSGEAALALFEPGKFDLVITDYSMRDMKGNQLVAIIRQRSPDQRIIMATGLAYEMDDTDGRAAGVDLVIDKPFSLTELPEAIVRVLS